MVLLDTKLMDCYMYVIKGVQCVLALYTQYFPELSKKKSRGHNTRVGFEPMTFAILEQCLTN